MFGVGWRGFTSMTKVIFLTEKNYLQFILSSYVILKRRLSEKLSTKVNDRRGEESYELN